MSRDFSIRYPAYLYGRLVSIEGFIEQADPQTGLGENFVLQGVKDHDTGRAWTEDEVNWLDEQAEFTQLATQIIQSHEIARYGELTDWVCIPEMDDEAVQHHGR